MGGESFEQPVEADGADEIVGGAQREVVGHVAASGGACAPFGFGDPPRPFRVKFAHVKLSPMRR